MQLMQPWFTVVVRDDFVPVGDLTQDEILWLLSHMDWEMENLGGGFVAFHLQIPVTRN